VTHYEFIEAEKAELPVQRCCRLLKVSRAAYYVWAAHKPTARQLSDAELTGRIKEIFEESRGTYGAPRVHAALRKQGIHCGKKRVARLMATAGLAGRCQRKTIRTTIPDPEAKALDLIRRAFGPDGLELDVCWVSDITYIRTWEGWMYLATVLDLASRRVVGWAMDTTMDASLVCDALNMAVTNRRPPAGLVFHSDRGTQYTSDAFRRLLAQHQMVQSLSRPRQCWDNAVAESWFATLKRELISEQTWPTVADARQAVFQFIEGWYNLRRLHSSIGYLSPNEYEQKILSKLKEHNAA
jgi:transposase InsO family protein